MNPQQQQTIARLQEAVEAGPTPGEWTVYKSMSTPGARLGIDAPEHSIILWGDREEDNNGVHGRDEAEEVANAAYIAAANPTAIRSLLDLLREQREALEACSAYLGGHQTRSIDTEKAALVAIRAALNTED